MISALFHASVYNPIYNALVYFVGILPTHDVGVAVVIVTIIVRIILYPLSHRAIVAQMKMKEIAPEVDALKAKLKDKPDEQGRAVLALYKERGVHPFSGFLLLLIQLPILFGLYFVFARGGLPSIHADLLYPFVHLPSSVNMEFLGFIDMSKRSVLLAVVAMLAQLVYTRLSMGPRGSKTPVETVGASFSGDLAKSFDLQARYLLPLMVGVIGYSIAAAAPLYWITGNIFMIGQELLAGRRFNPKK